ncbi:hypothetical protein [Streptomyces sp. NPDC059786]|uniref:hypothetical protein n=1 Tax=Streptomyces sp. NPDC059786 TaxID=3346946 RepID=UPI00365C64A2
MESAEIRRRLRFFGGRGSFSFSDAQGGGQNAAAVGDAVGAVERLVGETAK